MTHKRKKHNFILHITLFQRFWKILQVCLIIGIVFDTLNRFYLNYSVIKTSNIRNFVIESSRPPNLLTLLMFSSYLLKKSNNATVVEIYFRICYEAINLKKIN